MIFVRWRRRDPRQPERSLHDRCTELIRGLDLPAGTLTIQDVCDHLGRQRDRVIQLMPLRLPQGAPSGLWVSAESEDYVVFEQRLAPVHRYQVILHELGHVVCDHEEKPVLDPEDSRVLLPSLDPGLVRRILGREHSHTDAEHEAELVGSLLGQRISRWTAVEEYELPAGSEELRRKLSVLLGIPTRQSRG